MSRKFFVSAVAILASAPAVLALTGAIRFHLHNRTNGSIVVLGEKREYLLYVPPSCNHARPAPLVISLHGAGGWPTQQMEVSGWNRLADQNGFIVVYPAGASNVGPRVWEVRDVSFIAALIDKIESEYNIDRQRVFVNGLSNGGGMSFVLSCALSDRIAAVGMVAAAQTFRWNRCTDRRPVPMIAFHGTDDPIVPYRGGMSWAALAPFPDIGVWTAKWARRNGCASRPVESVAAPDVTRREYTNCADDAGVVLYTIRGGGHTWPGGQPMPEWFVGPTSRSIDATREMWAFFRAHPLAAHS